MKRIAAKLEIGNLFNKLGNRIKLINIKNPWIIADNLVLPPDWILADDLTITWVTGKPPIKPLIM